MGKVIGIDLGTTNSCVAIMSGGDPVVIANAEGSRTTPSVVGITDKNERLVGQIAKRQAITNPENTIFSVKRLMGRKFKSKEVQEAMKRLPYKVVEADNGDAHVELRGKRYSPPEVSAMILQKMRQTAEDYLGEKVTEAVVTVPAYFDDSQRQATKDAGQIAGLNVLRIINEPTAASLAYGLDKKKDERIVVYDLGGGTFDVTVVRYSPTNFRVLATDGDVMLGGLDWTQRIVEHVAEQFKRKYGSDPLADPETRLQFASECEQTKLALSSKNEVPISLYFEGKTLNVALTRGDFERMTADLLQRTEDTTELVLQQAGIEVGQLDEIVLVGGSTHMPAVWKMLERVSGRAPSRTVSPEEAVAQGAAIHAAILEARATDGTSKLGQMVRKRLESDAGEAVASSPEDFAAFVKADIPRWEKLVRYANATPG